MSNKLYTLGYAQPNAKERLEQIMSECGSLATIVDIREYPHTSYALWDQANLVRYWGDRYVWKQSLGNINYARTGPVILRDPVTGIGWLVQQLQSGQNLILLCGCKVYAACHRKHVADLVKAAMPDVEVVGEVTQSRDVVVTVPKSFGLDAWIDEGDPVGAEWSGEEWHYYLGGNPPDIQPGSRVYVVYNGTLRGYSPLVRIDRIDAYRYGLVRHGGAVAVTIPEYIQGFRGFRYRWWNRDLEIPFPDWQNPDAKSSGRPQEIALTIPVAKVKQNVPVDYWTRDGQTQAKIASALKSKF